MAFGISSRWADRRGAPRQWANEFTPTWERWRHRSFFKRKRQTAMMAHVSDESIALRDAYLHAGIVDNKSLNDALHVALATVSSCHLIVSWNFKHIVNFRRISLYNEVNKEKGYAEIRIHSPMEVIENER